MASTEGTIGGIIEGSIEDPTATTGCGTADAELLEGAAAAAPAAAADAPPMFDTKRARAIFSASCRSCSALRFFSAFLFFEARPSVAPVVLAMLQSKRPPAKEQKTSKRLHQH